MRSTPFGPEPLGPENGGVRALGSGPMQYRIELPERGGADAVRGFIADWVQHPALRDIVESEGGDWPSGTLSEQVAALHEFSSRWDFRGGAERLELSAGDQRHDEARITRAAEQLGLTTAAPPAATH